MIDPQSGPTGVPLLDAISAAMLAAYEEGTLRERARAAGRSTCAKTIRAHNRTCAAADEVVRLWRQFEVNAARTAPQTTATAAAVVPPRTDRATPG